MHRFQKAVVVSFAAGAMGSVLALTPFGSAIENDIALQVLYTIRGPIEAPPEAVVVGIDKRSADRFGLSPKPRKWPREMHARLIDNLVLRGVSVIVFDLDLSEPRDDEAFAAAITRSERVVIFQRIDVEKIPVNRESEDSSGKIVQEKIVFPVEQLRVGAMGLGPFPLPKVPARVDQFWAFKATAGNVWPTLPVVALQVYALPALDDFLARLKRVGFQRFDLLPQGRAYVKDEKDLRRLMRSLRLEFAQRPKMVERFLRALDNENGKELSADTKRVFTALAKLYRGEGDYHINYYGPPGTIKTIPYYAVLNDDDPSDPKHQLDLYGKVVFVGASEISRTEQKDDFYTVYSQEDGVDLSGVEIAASAFANLLTDSTLRRLSNLTTFSIILVFGGLVGVSAYLPPGVRAVALTLGIGAIYFGSTQFLFIERNLVIPVVVPLLFQLPLALLMGLLLQYLGVKRERENVSRAIRHYVPENVAESLTRGGVSPATAELVYGTCLATDATHYTTLSEALAPQDLVSLMNEYYDLLGAPVVRHNGTIAEIVADSMMCVWSAQQPEQDLRLHACLAALDIRQAVDRFNQRHEDRALPTRIGLHAGWVAMGHVGGGGRFSYSVTGDTANTASRIEGLNKHIGTTILASEAVVSDLDRLFLRRIGSFRLEGKSGALSIFEIIGRRENARSADINLCERFASALSTFEAKRWSEAAERFAAVLSVSPADGPTRFYLERSRQYSAAPPSGDGWIIQMETK